MYGSSENHSKTVRKRLIVAIQRFLNEILRMHITLVINDLNLATAKRLPIILKNMRRKSKKHETEKCQKMDIRLMFLTRNGIKWVDQSIKSI